MKTNRRSDYESKFWVFSQNPYSQGSFSAHLQQLLCAPVPTLSGAGPRTVPKASRQRDPWPPLQGKGLTGLLCWAHDSINHLPVGLGARRRELTIYRAGQVVEALPVSWRSACSLTTSNQGLTNRKFSVSDTVITMSEYTGGRESWCEGQVG